MHTDFIIIGCDACKTEYCHISFKESLMHYHKHCFIKLCNNYKELFPKWES